MSTAHQFHIKIDCHDKAGLLHNITRIIHENSLNIISLQEHVDSDENYFFAHICVESTEQKLSNFEQEKTSGLDYLSSVISQKLPENANISTHQKEKKNIIIFVSKESHCLGEIILRAKYENLPCNILAVIGNHDNNIRELCDFAEIPFHHVPSPKDIDRKKHEEQILKILSQYPSLDYIVLARYMRILSKEFTEQFPHQIINIHHSFLPAFIGANPYRQAKERGVKIIGATAHYVTENLDEGPIIAQQVLPIDHRHSVKELQKIGRDSEKLTLAHALELVFDDRVFVFKNRTIIL